MEMEDDSVCQVCSDFEPQAWRKSLCRNCFHSLDEHSEELLAAEGAALEQEKESEKRPEAGKKTEPGKSLSGGKGKDVGGEKDKVQEENAKGGKSGKPPLAPASKSVGDSKLKGRGTGMTSSTSSTSLKSSPSKSLPSSPSLPSLSSPSSSTSSTSTTSPSTSSVTPMKSTLPSSTATSATTSTKTQTTTSSTKASAAAQGANTSKAKSLTSKFESQSSTGKDPKPVKRPSEIRLATNSVSALTGKLSSESPSQNKTATLKTTKTSKAEEKNSGETLSNSNWTSSVGDKGGEETTVKKVDGEKKEGGDGKDKKLSSAFGEKDPKSFMSTRNPKAAPFGKDMLKSTKDTLKKEKEKSTLEKNKDKDSVRGKTEFSSSPPKGKEVQETSKSSAEKANSNNNKADEKESALSDSRVPDKSSDKKPEAGGSAGTASTKQEPSSVSGVSNTADENKGGPGSSRQAAKSPQVQKTGGISPVKSGIGKETKEESEERKNKVRDTQPTDVRGKFQDVQEDSGGNSHAAKGPFSTAGVKGQASHVGAGKSGEDEKKRNDTAISPVVSQASGLRTSKSLATTTDTKNSSTPSTTSSAKDAKSTPSALSKFQDFEKNKEKVTDKPSSLSTDRKSSFSKDGASEKPDAASKTSASGADVLPSPSRELANDLKKQLGEKEKKLVELSGLLSTMEEQVKTLEVEKETLEKNSSNSQKDEMGKLLQQLRGQLGDMEKQCSRLEGDNALLTDNLRVQEASIKLDQETRGKNEDNVDLEKDLELTEEELEEVKEENKELKREIMEMKNEMDEMYDTFRENEHDEFRELQKELEMTAKNCRILQFKLRKAERRNEQIEEDRLHYEEKLRGLQDQFDSQDAKNHIRVLEEELRVAKEVSSRLHDELDIVDDKKNKALEDNRHLTELLEHTDKRQFRMEMEIDKLRDMVADLKQQLKESKSSGHNNNNNMNNINNLDASPDRKVLSTIFTRSID